MPIVSASILFEYDSLRSIRYVYQALIQTKCSGCFFFTFLKMHNMFLYGLKQPAIFIEVYVSFGF